MTAPPHAYSASPTRANAELVTDKALPNAPRRGTSAQASSPQGKSGWGPFRLFSARPDSPPSPPTPPSPLFGTSLMWTGEQMVDPARQAPPAAPAPSPSPTPSGRFKLPGLGRARSEVDLRASKDRDRDRDRDFAKAEGDKRSKGPKASPHREQTPPVPALPRDFVLGQPTKFKQLAPVNETLPGRGPAEGSPSLAPSPMDASTPTPMQAEFFRPLLRERVTTPVVPKCGPFTHSASSSLSSGPPASFVSYGSYGSHGSFGSLAGTSSSRQPRTPESARSRPSTAQSGIPTSPNAMRSYPVTPPGHFDSSISLRSGQSAYFGSHSFGRSRQAAHVVALQAGWLQDDMLRELGLGRLPVEGGPGRLQRDLLLGALINDVLDLLGRALELSPAAMTMLRERRDRLYATRSEANCDGPTTACQVEQYAILHKMSGRCADDTANRSRYRGERNDRAVRERHENDFARFLYDALELGGVFASLKQTLPSEARELLGRNTSAIPAAEAERLLSSLNLSPAQQARLKTHLERVRQANSLSSPQGSLDSSTTAERDELNSP